MPSTTPSRHEPHVDEPRSRFPAARRHDIYANIHKALRLCATQTLAAVGSADARDDEDVARIATEVRAMIALAHGHLEKEEAFIHPLMEARRPGSAGRTRAEHEAHERSLHEVGDALAALEATAPDADRDGAASRLYRALARFVAADFAHMDAEETGNNAVLWATCTDDEIVAVERRIVASLAPDEARAIMRWMLPALDPHARFALLSGMRAAVPAPVFEGVLTLARGQLSPRDARRLEVALAA